MAGTSLAEEKFNKESFFMVYINIKKDFYVVHNMKFYLCAG